MTSPSYIATTPSGSTTKETRFRVSRRTVLSRKREGRGYADAKTAHLGEERGASKNATDEGVELQNARKIESPAVPWFMQSWAAINAIEGSQSYPIRCVFLGGFLVSGENARASVLASTRRKFDNL